MNGAFRPKGGNGVHGLFDDAGGGKITDFAGGVLRWSFRIFPYFRPFHCILLEIMVLCLQRCCAAAGGWFPSFCGGQLLTPDFTEGGDPMVTYSELFQFVIMLTGIIALIYQVAKKK